MSLWSYKCDKSVCPKEIQFSVLGGRVSTVIFKGGCAGNTKAIASLVEGMEINDVIQRLKFITCGDKGTSCGGELARALQMANERELHSHENY
jgi:uncharacterized protein (TIGR03905 family)